MALHNIQILTVRNGEFASFIRTSSALHGIFRFCTIIHTNMRRTARNSSILYDYSYKHAPHCTGFSAFVWFFIQTCAALHGIFRFCTIIHTNMRRTARDFPILYDYSYKHASHCTEFSAFVWFFV